MQPSQRSFFVMTAAALVATSVATPDHPARADEPRAPTHEIDPATILQRVDAKLGAQYVTLPQLPPRDDNDKTLAPYLYVAGGNPDTERLPLKKVSAQAQIAGPIARVRVQQTFENNGQKPIEAIYVFPASTRAAVHGMRMKIGARTVEAKIEKRQEAREQYEAAKAQGRRTSLLEQQRANVFTMNVANLMPGDRIDVELDYSELLVPEDSTYEFVFPTVVGPRYGGGADPQKDKWIANPYLAAGSPEPFQYDISAHLETGIALKELTSPSHKIAVNYRAQSSADVKLDHVDQAGGGNKDFILRYRLAGDQVETGAMLFPGDKENYFLMMMEPPHRPSQAQIPPREYIFVLDVSGSMYGFPLETAKALIKDLIGSLRPSDYFNLVLFAGASYTMSPRESLPATQSNIQSAISIVDQQRGGGGTELMGGLRAAYEIPKFKQAPGLSRSVVVITDGYVGVEAQAFKYIREHLGEANLFSFGIGTSVNRALIEGMARAGQGEPFVVLRGDRAPDEAAKFRKYIQAPVLSNIAVRFDGFGGYDVAPQHVPDVMAERPVVVFGKYRGGPFGKIRVDGMTGRGAFSQTIEVGPHLARKENTPLAVLWARKWVEILDDERAMDPGNKDLEGAITSLGLSYTMLTQFTSFVAVDSQVANKSGQSETVEQPLPLPEGVSNHAVAVTPPPAPAAVMGKKSGSGGGAAYGMIGSGGLGNIGGGRGRGGSAGHGYGTRSYSGAYYFSPHAAAASPAAPPPPMTTPLPPPRVTTKSKAPEPRASMGSASAAQAKDGNQVLGGLLGTERSIAKEEKAAPDGPRDARVRGDADEALSQDRPVKAGEDMSGAGKNGKRAALTNWATAAQNLSQTKPLVDAVRAAMQAALGESVFAGTIHLRLTIDANGKVVSVAWLDGKVEPAVDKRLREALVGMKTATLARGAATGTLDVTVRVTH